jgi:hypothetical protein
MPVLKPGPFMSADTSTPNTVPPEDIDLLVLLERSILFFRRYKWLFTISIVLAIGFGGYRYLSLPKVYDSRMVVHSYILSNQEHVEIIDNWNNLLKRHEYTAMAEIFNCPEDFVRKIKKIEATEIQKVFTATNPSGFYIDVNVTDNSMLPELQKKIVYGIENGEYVKNRITFKKERIKEMINEIKGEIVKFDSTKAEMEKIISGKERPSSSLIIDGSNINRQWIDMNEKLLFFQEELNFTNGIQVLQGLSKFNKPIGPKLLVSIILGLILFLPIAYIIALVSSVKKQLKARSLPLKL